MKTDGTSLPFSRDLTEKIMNDLNLTKLLLKKMGSYPRKRGRYNASELYGITKGYVTPELWLNPKPKLAKDAIKMWNGTLAHEQIQKLLPKEGCELKREHLYKGITLVGKADYQDASDPNSDIWEFKTSDVLMDTAKEGHEYQGRLYCTMFQRPRTIIYQPVQTADSLFLKNLGFVTRDDEWFDEQMEKLYAFHLKVEPLWQTT